MTDRLDRIVHFPGRQQTYRRVRSVWTAMRLTRDVEERARAYLVLLLWTEGLSKWERVALGAMEGYER